MYVFPSIYIKSISRRSRHGSVETNLTIIHEDAGSIPGLAQRVKASGVAVSCGVGCRCGSDLALLWLWRRPVATALIQPLARETSCAALKRQKKNVSYSLALSWLQQTASHLESYLHVVLSRLNCFTDLTQCKFSPLSTQLSISMFRTAYTYFLNHFPLPTSPFLWKARPHFRVDLWLSVFLHMQPVGRICLSIL